MKRLDVYIVFILWTCMLSFSSCHQESIKPTKEQVSSMTSTSTSTNKANSYRSSTYIGTSLHTQSYHYSKVLDLLNNPLTDHFRIRITRIGNIHLQSELVAVDSDFNIVGKVNGSDEAIQLNLENLNQTPPVSSETLEGLPETLASHIIQPQVAFNYIQGWNNMQSMTSSIHPYTKYGDKNIEFFYVKRIVIDYIVNQSTSKGLTVFWGLNNDNKLTPVLMGHDNTQHAISTSTLETGFIFDTLRPCPPFCHEYEMEILQENRQ
ncbi:MAG: hypothetical protein MK212_22245 [Saprospiraceae bacterium]|nr:hypothetical protein [Saprospiraceae bacterium]